MTTLTQQRTRAALPAPWPADRYEVYCERRPPHGGTRDRYHYAELAVESARALGLAGLAARVVVTRLADGVVIYDAPGGIELPVSAW
ncbi:hypothetical protein OIE66_23740 [Nonomuraea sp. NBC_01738]|uniref:hypothetical protein n=1 Tax=Nonomuraea sp. NBC_01738 TaxID=2976003 RepID=UPI002E160901|nr:hypothetical protein OIE66_23740 [Nonomuraea sp. NBC_01738]